MDSVVVQVQALSTARDRDQLVRVLQTTLKEADSSDDLLAQIPLCVSALDASIHTVGVVFLLGKLARSAFSGETTAVADPALLALFRGFLAAADFSKIVDASPAAPNELRDVLRSLLAASVRCGRSEVEANVIVLETSARRLAVACG